MKKKPDYGTSRKVHRARTDEETTRATESLKGTNRVDVAWDKVRKQNAKGLNWGKK